MSCQATLLIALVPAVLSAQVAGPSFTRAGMAPVQSWLPGDLVTIYGEHLASPFGCREVKAPSPGIYPDQRCGTQVTVGGIPAGLLFVGDAQINLKIPAEVPASGEAAVVVIVDGIRSRPVMFPFGKPRVILTVEGKAYVRMPVWISLRRPVPHDTRYPYGLRPGDFGGGRFEARHHGEVLQPFRIPDPPGGIAGGLMGGSIAPPDSPRGRLPLHLQYRFDTPGRYEIRFIGTRLEFGGRAAAGEPAEVELDSSDWTTIDVLPYSESERRQWVLAQASNMPSSPGLLVGDAIPGLLAVPDEYALRAILPALYHPDPVVRRYAAASLTMFGQELVARELTLSIRRNGPTEEIVRLLDQQEELFQGGHSAFLEAVPGFLVSGEATREASALQYLVWAQNHDWGKTAQFEAWFRNSVFRAAPSLLESADKRVTQILAEALGTIPTDDSRRLLWRLVDSGADEGQAMIALTFIGHPRDLHRLADALTRTTDPSLPYHLHRAYGAASLPLLESALREAPNGRVRMVCAEELIRAGRPAGFAWLLQAMAEGPSFRGEALQFVRDTFPKLRGQSEQELRAFLLSRSRGQ